jgi:inosose dehydratase
MDSKDFRELLTVTRRQVMLAGASGFLAAAQSQPSRLSAAGYIWQQYASRQKKRLADLLDEIFAMARNAGFKNVELSDAFFSPTLRDGVVKLVRSNGLSMPSVYVGGAMHDPALANQTISRALEIGVFCKDLGCSAVVNNPDPKPQGAQKSDQELAIQAESLNRMGLALSEKGLQLRVHQHSPEMAANAREWRQILRNTDPKYVSLCSDLDWMYQGGMDPIMLLREAGTRVTEIHVRNSKDKLWLESFGEGDLDYQRIAATLKELKLSPLIVVELAYRDNTIVTRSLEEDLRLSRAYAEKVFGNLL